MTEADFLSRQENNDKMDPNIFGETMNMILQVDLKQLQNEQENLKKITDTLNGSSTATKKDPLAEDFIMKNNILYRIKDHIRRKTVIVIPRSLTQKIIENFHSSPLEGGHLHLEKTLDKIQEKLLLETHEKASGTIH